jgi:uncharacterized membrane protein YoaK (UPF0700 family)
VISAQREQTQAWQAALLAWVAGGVDAVGFLALSHLFTAQMSGNSVAAAAYTGQGHWRQALFRASPIPAFVCGAAIGTAVMETLKARSMRSPAAALLSLEAMLLVCLLLWGRPHVPAGATIPQAALLALAMGMQNAALRHVGPQSVRTTFVSGVLTDFAAQTVQGLFKQGADRHSARAHARLLAGLWVAYTLGAVVGGVAEGPWALRALALPVSGMAVLIAADLARPLPAD